MITREMILPHDLELFGKSLDRIFQLIQSNPFSERMSFLLANPDLAHKKVKNSVGELRSPNCIGTALFIAGVSNLDYPYHGYDFELNPHMRETEESKRELFHLFNRHLERRIPGALVFSYSVESDDWHAGIYIGMLENEHLFFAQHGPGLRFGPESSRCYASPEYFIPKTLK